MLGDLLSSALSSVGLDSDRVEKWLGRPCHCKERQEKLNQLDAWARRVIQGKVDRALLYLNQLMEQDQ